MRIIKAFPIQPPKHHKRNRAEQDSPWFKVGTDADYQAWCRKQPSALSGRTDDIVYAHYRTAANSGTAVKPVYSGIPLNFFEHLAQHQDGQYSMMPKTWWQLQVSVHLECWKASRLDKSQ